jgi:hypothetical protein
MKCFVLIELSSPLLEKRSSEFHYLSTLQFRTPEILVDPAENSIMIGILNLALIDEIGEGHTLQNESAKRKTEESYDSKDHAIPRIMHY